MDGLVLLPERRENFFLQELETHLQIRCPSLIFLDLHNIVSAKKPDTRKEHLPHSN